MICSKKQTSYNGKSVFCVIYVYTHDVINSIHIIIKKMQISLGEIMGALINVNLKN